MKDLFEWNAGEEARDEALFKVTENCKPWMESALAVVPDIPMVEFTGEDLRHFVVAKVGSPHHSNAFGAMVNAAVRKGLITATGEWRKMKLKSSHARKTPVYALLKD